MWKRLHVKYPLFLSNLNETWIFSTYLRINGSSIKFHENPSCGQTDGHDKANGRSTPHITTPHATSRSTCTDYCLVNGWLHAVCAGHTIKPIWRRKAIPPSLPSPLAWNDGVLQDYWYCRQHESIERHFLEYNRRCHTVNYERFSIPICGNHPCDRPHAISCIVLADNKRDNVMGNSSACSPLNSLPRWWRTEVAYFTHRLGMQSCVTLFTHTHTQTHSSLLQTNTPLTISGFECTDVVKKPAASTFSDKAWLWRWNKHISTKRCHVQL